MEGWIKLHRKIINHWIFKNPYYLKAWILMLITVNYENKKVLLNGQLIECKRGQSLLSIDSWVVLFGISKTNGGWTYQKVRTFFELLEKDKMICKENIIKTTKITICNYDTYQEVQQPNNKIITTKQQPNNNQITTTKESKKDKESKEIKDIYDFDLFWIDYDKKVGSKIKLIAKWNKLTDEEKLKIKNYIPIYKKSQPDNKYRKNIETFLNNKSWNDEIIGIKNIDFKIKNVNIDDNYTYAQLKPEFK